MSHNHIAAHLERLRSPLLAFAYRLTKNEDDANDLLQETNYKALRHWQKFNPDTNLHAWLTTIMRNTFINGYRQKKRRQTLTDSSDNKYLLNSGEQLVSNQAESKIAMDDLMAVVNAMAGWMRIPFLMYYRGYKYDEIATELGVPLGTIKSRIFFARRYLRKELGHLYEAKSMVEIL